MRGHFINGKELTGGSGVLRSLNPATGDVLDEVAIADSEIVTQAVMTASAAQKRWASVPLAQRSEAISKLADALRREYGEEGQETPLKSLIRDETGRRMPEADLEVSESADVISYFADNGARWLEPERLTLDEKLWPTKKSRVCYEPVGVVAVIKPWNYPLELPVWSISAALMAGNAVVFKPSEHSPLVGLRLAEIFTDAGLPPGLLNVITGDGGTGDALINADGIGLVSFTGSVKTGRAVAKACAEHLRPCKLELGGIDPAIVLNDADLELTANGITWGSFANAGQVCVRPKRVLIHESIYPALTERLTRLTSALQKDRDFGPLISKQQLELVASQVEETVSQGANLRQGGRQIEGPGFYYAPTILTDVAPSHRIFTEECFGPVMALTPVASNQEAVELANESVYGLGASIWGERESAEKIASKVQGGMVWINDVNVAFPQAPWGGVKNSGYGVDLGRWGLDEYAVKKHINVETSNDTTRDWWFPYDD
ncbi:MAG: aldehyde dehydrogenase family protein [Frankiaceae bacterium]